MPKHYIDAMRVYDTLPFDPTEVKPGNRWRELAMREWSETHKPGLLPIVSDKVPIFDDEDHCLSCGCVLDFYEEERDPALQVYKMNVCSFCNMARTIISQKLWSRYKKSADPTEEGLQES